MPQYSKNSFHSFVPQAGLRFTSLLALALIVGGAGVPRAEAQGFFGAWDGPPPKVKKVKRLPSAVSQDDEDGRSSAKGKKSKSAETTERASSGPLVISVSLNRQRLTVFDANGPIAESPISSGRVGYSTPAGVYTVLEKRRMHHSNLYSGAPMPNMQRITWSGIALHAGVLPGYPASHGCIRLPQGFSKKLFGMTKNGTRVIVTRDSVVPVPIAHDRLFVAFPPEADLVTGSVDGKETQVADASMGTAGSSSTAVSAALGLTTVAAAESVGQPLATPQLSYRERRRVEAEKLNLEIRTAGYEKVEKSILLTQAQKAAAIAREPYMSARSDDERLAGDLAELEQVLSMAEHELADLKSPPAEPTGKRKGKKDAKKPMDESKRIAKIVALEAKVARLPSEIEATRAAWEQAHTAVQAVEAVALEAEDKRRAAMTALAEVQSRLSQALAKEQAAKKLEAKRNLPVSVFISRAKQRLYIRQGYDDILDVAVTFDRPDEPVGTHVFTALAFTEQKTAMRWSVASVPYDPSRSSKKKDKSGKAKSGEPVVQVSRAVQTPQAALDRITVPQEVRDQIADVMKPGSSVVISDLSIGNETGEYTDFIVPIR
ncbi:L,D-transpeptidase family protein [Hyphomicrobium sp.]|uniref:L,D-transpeptidase family protein n=1 Tax=Hyphomicrobium sp. TaxID=82 RepID=UPI002E34A269|nr:L,D-transpeptidase family protein [Hyphomicrobium sp.]HEX2841438.1 L,D-transpeptidase family protein [Hyphomicrobium sp.]